MEQGLEFSAHYRQSDQWVTCLVLSMSKERKKDWSYRLLVKIILLSELLKSVRGNRRKKRRSLLIVLINSVKSVSPSIEMLFLICVATVDGRMSKTAGVRLPSLAASSELLSEKEKLESVFFICLHLCRVHWLVQWLFLLLYSAHWEFFDLFSSLNIHRRRSLVKANIQLVNSVIVRLMSIN
jgi:hypothetical protein